MEILDYKTRLAERLIKRNPDITIGEYWDYIKEDEPKVMFISSAQEVRLPKRYYPPNRASRKQEPQPESIPFKRPAAIYDNRSHDELLRKYS